MAKSSESKNKTLPFHKWITSYAAVSSWLAQYDLEDLVARSDGLVKISGFLPDHVAQGLLQTLQQLPEPAWNMTAAEQDYSQNNIEHQFLSTKSELLSDIFRLFGILVPDSLSTFSAARYDQQHHIAPHDDRAYTEVRLDDGSVITCSRDIAVIYYLTRDWTPELGGNLVDLETGTTYVPEFNSLVAFRIPRWHQVTEMHTDRQRYTIFGWFLEPGIKYPLCAPEEEAAQYNSAATVAAEDGTRSAPGSSSPAAATVVNGNKNPMHNEQPMAPRPGHRKAGHQKGIRRSFEASQHIALGVKQAKHTHHKIKLKHKKHKRDRTT